MGEIVKPKNKGKKGKKIKCLRKYSCQVDYIYILFYSTSQAEIL